MASLLVGTNSQEQVAAAPSTPRRTSNRRRRGVTPRAARDTGTRTGSRPRSGCRPSRPSGTQTARPPVWSRRPCGQRRWLVAALRLGCKQKRLVSIR